MGESWSTRPICTVDLETTGRDPFTARVVTACIATIDGETTTVRNWLLDPQVPIPPGAAAVHGVDTARARAEGADYATGYAEIRAALDTAWAAGHTVVAFNAAYDLTIVHHEGLRLGHPPLAPGAVADPYVIDREVDRYRKGRRTLTDVCAHYGVPLDDAHQAEADALAAAGLVRTLVAAHPRLADQDITAAQAQWHRARQEDFAAYLRRAGRGGDADGVDGRWPIRFDPPARP